jgi:hypothetical protein
MFKNYHQAALSFVLVLGFMFIASSCDEDIDFSTQTNNNLLLNESTGALLVDNPKEPVLEKVHINGDKVTLEFRNYAAPDIPWGGFELIVNKKRTRNEIIPWVYSSEQRIQMSFTMKDAQNQCYQVYARWSDGFIASNEVCGATGSTGSEKPITEPEPEPDPTPAPGPVEDVTLPISNMKLLRGYEFENNIGRNVDVARDGLKVHHLGHKNGKVVSVDGVGAYHFRITPGTYSTNNPTWRQELVPRNLPSPYFNNGFEAKWGMEYVYQIRMKMTSDYDLGKEYLSVISTKNDYTISREGSFIFFTEGDHYYFAQKYAERPNIGRNEENNVPKWYGSVGENLTPGKDFSRSSLFGSGYKTIENDKGKWVTWTIHVKWSYNNDGFLRVYKGDNLFHSYNGPNSYNDQKGPYIKFGLYNSWWKHGNRTGSNSQEMYVDYFRVYAVE